MAADPAMAERYVVRLPVTRGEVEYAVREEMAMSLEDFLERRARLLLWDPQKRVDFAQPVPDTMPVQLGWDRSRRDAEVEAYRALVQHGKSFQLQAPRREASG